MVFQPSDRSAARWNTHFRFALTTGLRFSAHSNENTTTQKGDISNELTMGTFLKSFDMGYFDYLRLRLALLCFVALVGVRWIWAFQKCRSIDSTSRISM